MIYLTRVRDALAALHPATPWLALTLATFAIAYAVRRWRPSLWLRFFAWVPAAASDRVRDALQAFTLAAPSTVLAALASGGSVTQSLIGLAAGLAAPVLHLVLRAAPVPYQGALGGIVISPDLRARLDAADARYSGDDTATKLLVLLLVVSTLRLTTACGSAVPAKGPCSAEERAAISAIYFAELAAYCGGKGESCPYLPEIDARHEARRKEWVSCQP